MNPPNENKFMSNQIVDEILKEIVRQRCRKSKFMSNPIIGQILILASLVTLSIIILSSQNRILRITSYQKQELINDLQKQ